LPLCVVAQGNSTSFPPGWNGEATTPPMGWRSWNAFGANINDKTFRDAVDAITAKVWSVEGHSETVSLLDVGYTRVGIDEGWENCSGTDPNHGLRQHDADGFPMINTQRFPDLKALVDYGHSKDILMGWYLNGCACGERQERLINYVGDIQRLHEFGFDAAKFDGCGAATNMTYYAELMDATGHTFEVENCHWGSCGADSWYHNPDGSSCPTQDWCPFNHYRTSGDINSGLTSWYANLQSALKFLNDTAPLSVPSCWAYPDMMEVGRITGGSFAWSRAHFGAWCVISAPLILGLDLGDTATLASIIPFITNPEAIAVNQNWAGHPGRLAAEFMPPGWSHGKGALPAGHDRDGWPRNATLAEAQKACDADAGCGGITYHSADAAPEGALKMYLKDAGVDGATGDEDWTHYSKADAVQVWVKPQPGGRLAVFVVNPAQSGKAAQVEVSFAALGIANATSASVRDIWSRQEIGDVKAALKATVEPLDSAFLLLTPRS